MNEHTICVGTVGSGVWYSSDSGTHWRQAKMDLPFDAEPGEILVRHIVSAPSNPSILLAGSDAGLYRSKDSGRSWALVDSPFYGTHIWSLAIHPNDPETILVGTKPPSLYRTYNGGRNWEELPLNPAKECFAGAPKVTSIVFDPRDDQTIWVGVEIDGVYKTKDGGNTWKQTPKRGDSPLNDDIHCVEVAVGEPTRVLATTPDGLWTSTDEGETWRLQEFPKFFGNKGISYCRGIALKADDKKVTLIANGNTIPGKTGAIRVSIDEGKSWNSAELSPPPNSTIYWLAVHPSDPNFIVANTLYGYIYISKDGGNIWEKLEREFGEVRGLAWIPTPESL